MMTTDQQMKNTDQPIDGSILAKIRKLLALAADKTNEHEAAVAAAHAQRLLLEHNISMAVLESTGQEKAESVGNLRQERAVKSGSGTKWREILAYAVARSGFCELITGLTTGKISYIWIGRDTDVQTSIYVFEYLERELERLSQEYSVGRWAQAKEEAERQGMKFHAYEAVLRQQNRHPLLARRSWLEGAVEGVTDHLTEEKKKREQHNDCKALVVVRGTEVAQYMKQTFKTKPRSIRMGDQDGSARAAGYDTGRNLRVAPGISESQTRRAIK